MSFMKRRYFKKLELEVNLQFQFKTKMSMVTWESANVLVAFEELLWAIHPNNAVINTVHYINISSIVLYIISPDHLSHFAEIWHPYLFSIIL